MARSRWVSAVGVVAWLLLARAEANPTPPPVAVQVVWKLERGLPIHTQLQAWAQRAGWTLLWRPDFSWRTAADASFEGEFSDAIEQVITALFEEGEPVRLILWEANQVAEVLTHAR